MTLTERAEQMSDYGGVPSGPRLQESANLCAEEPTSRFRPRYRDLTNGERQLQDIIKSHAALMEDLYKRAGRGRYYSLAMTALEESVMWITKELTS